jgi:hypothetical protein
MYFRDCKTLSVYERKIILQILVLIFMKIINTKIFLSLFFPNYNNYIIRYWLFNNVLKKE